MPFLGKYLGVDLADTTRLGTNLAPRSLPFASGTFTNASPRYITQGGSIIGPFAGGTLATKVIGGKRFAQFESSRSTMNTHSEIYRAAASNWTNVQSTVSDNATASPIGTLTADRWYENTANAAHTMVQTLAAVDAASEYMLNIYLKIRERYRFRLDANSTLSPFNGYIYVKLDDCTITTDTGTDYSGLIPLADGWFHAFLGVTSVGAEVAQVRHWILDNSGTVTYLGDGSSGLYMWGSNFIKSPYLTSYIPAAAAPVVRAKDQFNWPEAVVAASAPWIRTGFKFRLIFHQAASSWLTGTPPAFFLYSFPATAETVFIYLDPSDLKIKWAGTVSGALGETAALSWSLGATLDGAFTFDNGANSTLWINGGGISSTTYNGTSCAAIDGNVVTGMNGSEQYQADIFLISEPEPL